MAIPLFPLDWTIKIKESETELQRKFKKAVNRSLIKAAVRSAPSMNKGVRQTIESAITNSITYQSILSGQLKFNLGIPDGHVKLARILREWINSIEVKARPQKNNISFLIKVTGIESSFKDVLGLPEAKQANVNAAGRPTVNALLGFSPPELDWLRWLLLEGSNIIIAGFSLRGGRGRAGNYVMQETGGSWNVPAAYQGVAGNNFVTQAIKAAEPELMTVMAKEFKRFIK